MEKEPTITMGSISDKDLYNLIKRNLFLAIELTKSSEGKSNEEILEEETVDELLKLGDDINMYVNFYIKIFGRDENINRLADYMDYMSEHLASDKEAPEFID